MRGSSAAEATKASHVEAQKQGVLMRLLTVPQVAESCQMEQACHMRTSLLQQRTIILLQGELRAASVAHQVDDIIKLCTGVMGMLQEDFFIWKLFASWISYVMTICSALISVCCRLHFVSDVPVIRVAFNLHISDEWTSWPIAPTAPVQAKGKALMLLLVM